MEFETIKEMRDAIIYDKVTFQQFWSNYDGELDRKTIGRLWAKACHLINENNWKNYLCQRAANALKSFQDSLDNLYEEGECETDISTRLHLDVRTVCSLLW